MLEVELFPQVNNASASVDATAVPHSREAEEAVIGSVLINSEAYYEVARFLGAGEFYIHRHRFIWQAFASLVTKHSAVDILTVSEELECMGVLQEVGGPAYLTSLINQVPSSLDADHYARIVAQYAERRDGIALANRIAAAAYDQKKHFSIGEQAMIVSGSVRNHSQRVDTKEAASRMIDMLTNNEHCTTGIHDVDENIGGLFPDELSVLAGFSGTGKSAEKQQGARTNADNGKRVLLVDLEMTAAQTWFRMSCGDLQIDVNRVRSGKVSTGITTQVMEHAAKLAEQYKDNLVIYQAPMTPGDILTAVMIEKPDIVYVDVLKNIAGKRHDQTEVSWYDSVMNFLRINVAQKTHTHVQVLHHINRASSRENRKPTRHDLMFAGDSDADQIFLLYRKPADYDMHGTKTVVPITWITDKSRFGWTGEQDVNFNLVKQSFHGMTKKEEYL